MITLGRIRAPLRGFGLALALAVACLSAVPALAQSAPDPVALSFAFMGCNRIAHKDFKAIKRDDPGAANLPQLDRSFRDIAALDPVPPYVFFTGDLVMNLEDDDGKALKKQLDAWAPLFQGSPLNGKTTLIPLPGNHEMLMKRAEDKDDDEKVEVPNPSADARWLKWLKETGFDTFARHGNGPTSDPPNLDKLADDQSRLTYSFDVAGVHFVVVNTDTLNTKTDGSTNAPFAGWVPVHWIEGDVRAAQADPKIGAIFLVGHKPVMGNPKHEEKSILNSADHPFGDRLQSLFRANDKVRAYLCAHEHSWELAPFKTAPKVWQVIAGNAGSPLSKKWRPDGGTFYGFSRVNVYRSGKVGLVSYQRPVPNPYFGPPAPPAKPGPEVILYPGAR